MASGFSNFSDDVFVNLDLHTALPMPQGRETILQFCEAARKQFADMSDFYQREGGEFVLEGDRNAGSYRWLELASRRLSAGAFNPDDFEAAYAQHAWLLERSKYFLGVSPLDVESLDLVYGFNLDYTGNRDAIVCEALLAGSRLASLITEAGGTALNFEPSLIAAMDEACGVQCRVAVETRNSTYQVRTGHYEDEPISVYFTVRGHPPSAGRFEAAEALRQQAETGEDLLARVIIPTIVRPIASAIAAAQ